MAYPFNNPHACKAHQNDEDRPNFTASGREEECRSISPLALKNPCVTMLAKMDFARQAMNPMIKAGTMRRANQGPIASVRK